MNKEDDMYRHFILSKKKSRKCPIKKDLFTQILFFNVNNDNLGWHLLYLFQIINRSLVSPLTYLLEMIAIIILFLVSSFSQFVGHRILYIISYTSYSVLFILIYFNGLFPTEWILFISLRVLLLQQIIIQIYGVWPDKFGRIFAEFLFFHEVTKQIVIAITQNYQSDLICWTLTVMIVVNLIWLICGFFQPIFKSINDFKSPETDSVIKDFARLLCNQKILIFTLLYVSSTLSLNVFKFFQGKSLQELNENHQTLIFNANRILPILSMLLIRAFVNLNLKSSFWIIISLILLVILLIDWFILFEINNFANIDLVTFFVQNFIWLVTLYIQDVFMTPQYWQILLNIGIRNLDFVASYQLLAYGFSYLSYKLVVEKDNDLSLYIKQNSWILILSLIGIIISLSFIFYQSLGFKQYLYNSNTSQVEEDKFQIEIN